MDIANVPLKHGELDFKQGKPVANQLPIRPDTLSLIEAKTCWTGFLARPQIWTVQPNTEN